MRKYLFLVLAAIFGFAALASAPAPGFAAAGAGLRVFIKDEGFQEKNIVKPRIYLENIGSRTIRNFDLYYYFTAEPGKNPVVESYYAPSCVVELIRESRCEYAVRYRFRNVQLQPGKACPDRSGCVIGIHYSDWSPFMKANDYSNPGSPNWHPTRRVEVEVLDGVPHHRHERFEYQYRS